MSPKVSVVIPAYNQASYLSETIESVLGQTFQDYEVVVVDDESTDETPTVAQRYEQIHYVYQKNQGLAGARNTGIKAAKGDFVALLDSDDVWEPTYLEKMMRLADLNPKVTVYYCGVSYITQDSKLLPQAMGGLYPSPDDIYRNMLRTNALVPSTILMQRKAVMEVGLFDVAFRRLQDWELWIRLLRKGHQFAALPEALVRYRVHNTSLSTDPAGGQKAAMALAVKHFGPDDGRWETWSEDKRRMYGGVYRYHALTSSLLRQGDWQACAKYLRLALQVDPTLSEDLNLFYEIALGAQTLGQRGTTDQIDFNRNEKNLKNLLNHVFASPLHPALTRIKDQVFGTAYYALGLVAYNSSQYHSSWRFLLTALKYRFALYQKSQFTLTLIKSLVSQFGLQSLRHRKASSKS